MLIVGRMSWSRMGGASLEGRVKVSEDGDEMGM